MKVIFALCALVLTMSCQTPVTNVINVQGRHVVNSLWKEVPMSTVNAQGRGISNRAAGINLEANVAAYNAANIDDQWFIVDGDIPGIDEAPNCSIFIVDRVTHVPMIDDSGNPFGYTDWPRRQLVENYLGWVQYALSTGGVMYIDVIPPAPTPPTEEQIYASRQVYVVNGPGAILYHFDCSIVPPEWAPYTVAQYYAAMVTYANNIVLFDGNGAPDGPWHVINGQLYTEPN